MLAAIAISTGCGAAATSKQSAGSTSRSTDAARTPSIAAMPESLPEGSDDPGGSVSIIRFWGGGESHQPKPVRDLYAVFRRAPQARDLRTQEIARADAYGDSLDDGSTGTAPLGTASRFGSMDSLETRSETSIWSRPVRPTMPSSARTPTAWSCEGCGARSSRGSSCIWGPVEPTLCRSALEERQLAARIRAAAPSRRRPRAPRSRAGNA